MIKLIKSLVTVALGFIALIVFLIVGLWAFYSIVEINHTIYNGEGYGFEIGDSKVRSYEKATSLIEQDKLVGFDLMYAQQVYKEFYSPQDINQINEYFDRWDYWVISGLKGVDNDSVQLGFKFNQLNIIGYAEDGRFKSIGSWPNNEPTNSRKLLIGDSYPLVYEKLLEIANERSTLKVQPANLSNYRLPESADAKDYYLVKDFKRWTFRVGESFFSNSLTLTFNENDEIVKIHRNRYAFELP